MNDPHGIIVFGANGSGKTTFGRELARILGFKHMDHGDYAFEESEIPYSSPRSKDECVELMLSEIERHGSFVLSAVTGDFGEKITRFYEFAVYISAPHELRIKRIGQRANDQHGDRVREGGDMYEQQVKFANFAAARSLERIEQWAKTLVCPVISIDGAVDWRINAADTASRFNKLIIESGCVLKC